MASFNRAHILARRICNQTYITTNTSAASQNPCVNRKEHSRRRRNMIGGPAHPPTMTSANVRPVQKRDCPGRRWHSISATAASQAAAVHSPVQRDQVEARLAAARETVETISANMDQNVLGHDQVKRGVLLALLAREHVYIEGTWHTISLIFFFSFRTPAVLRSNRMPRVCIARQDRQSTLPSPGCQI